MEKTKYEKPVALDLSGRAATGQGPLACLTGTTVGPTLCSAGSDDAACYTGTGGFQFAGDCVPGVTATGAYSCLPGGTAGWECAGGSVPQGAGPCTVGPSA